MAAFVARVEFRFEAESLQTGGKRLRELANAAATVGFQLERGTVEPADDSEGDSPTHGLRSLDRVAKIRGTFP
jgi:hypothetical protein